VALFFFNHSKTKTSLHLLLAFKRSTLFFTLICLFLIFLITNSAVSQAENLKLPLKFTNISTDNGLSQNFVYSIAQDKQNFIWLATEDGLNRFDGKIFVHYRHQVNDPHSIADNIIRKVFVDKAGVLWVGTENGLSRYNQSSDNFDNFYSIKSDNYSLRDNFIWDIYQDNNDIIWISTVEGLHKYNVKLNNFTRVVIPASNNKLKDIRTIYQDKANNYWLGTYDQGIYIANNNWTYIQSLQASNKWNLSIQSKSLIDIQEIDQNYWLATDQGIYIINQGYQLRQHITVENSNKKLLTNDIRALKQFDDSHVWVGTNKGLNTINILNNEINQYKNSSKPRSLSENWLLTIFKDNASNMWLGNFATGVDVYSPVVSAFKHYLFNSKNNNISIESFTKTTDGNIWFSSDKLGLNQLLKSGKTTHISTPFEHDIALIESGNKNTLWIQTYKNDLFSLDTQTRKIVHHLKWTNTADNNVDFHFLVFNDFLWFTSNTGELVSYDTKEQKFQSFSPPTKNSSANIQLKALAKDTNGHIWLSSNNKIYKFSIKNTKFEPLNIASKIDFQINETMNIAVDENRIWLSSNSQGVMVINKNNLTSSVYNETNGLLNNNLNAILIDNSGNAWVSANNGISVINLSNNTIQNFGLDYGLKDNDFIRNSALADEKRYSPEQFYFGGINGFQQFNPAEILAISQQVPTPVLTNLLIANKDIKIKKSNKKNTIANNELFTIKKQINQLDTLTLAYQQSPFSIEFTAPNAKLPSQIRYRYKLVGLEKNWIEAGLNNNRATYTNLSAGSYTFVIQAYDQHHPAKVKTKQLTLHILPPWWLSTQAWVVYGLCFLLIIGYFILQIRHRRQYHLQIQQSEERLKLSLWGSGDEMWDWNITSGKIYRSNIWEALEFPQDGTRNSIDGQNRIAKDNKLTTKEKEKQLKNLQLKGNIHPQDIIRVHQHIEQYLNEYSQDQEVFETTYRIKNKEDRSKWIWVLDRGKIVERDANSQPSRMTGTLKDISQIKNAEERLKLFAKCIASISDAVIIYNRQFKVVDVNKAYQTITGESKSEVLNKELYFKLYNETFTNTVKKHLIVNGSWQGEIESQRKNSELYFADLNIDIIRDENNNISHFVGVFSDISDRKAAEEELRKLANSDTLTGLPNRSYFQANQSRLVQNKVPHALLVFDLDHFKKINDSLGHEFGDILLCHIGKRIISGTRKQDTVYRLGGDEFGLIIENTNDIHTITTIAKEILKHIAQPLKIRSHEMVLQSSIGIVLYPDDGASPQELLKNADTAMYHAKNNGGNQYQFFNNSMNKKAVKRLLIENLIRYGLKHDYFSVFYQPKIEITTGKIAGMEALVRFEHPAKGIVSPVTFIPVSEETGQIIEIGETVLRKSCFATKAWVDAGLFNGRIAVNLSAVQFTQPNLVEVIAGILKESQLQPKYLELEITEGTVMDSPQEAIEIMRQIRAMGIHLSLDDFGTGYSSLAYLKKFPLNTLKIDKAFVDDIEHSEQGRNMVATIVTIAHNLDLQVVAEGVEHQFQLDFLTSLKCEQLQGYLYSKPLTENDFSKYLYSHKITNKSTNFTKN